MSDDNKNSEEVKYFSQMFSGAGRGNSDQAMRLLISFNTIAISLLLRSSFDKECRKKIIETWRKTHIDDLNKELAKHTDMMEGTTLGKFLGSAILPDGEELRIESMKLLKQVQDGLEIALLEDLEEDDASE